MRVAAFLERADFWFGPLPPNASHHGGRGRFRVIRSIADIRFDEANWCFEPLPDSGSIQIAQPHNSESLRTGGKSCCSAGEKAAVRHKRSL